MHNSSVTPAAKLAQLTQDLEARGWYIRALAKLPSGGFRYVIAKHGEAFSGEAQTKLGALERAYERAGLGIWLFQQDRNPKTKEPAQGRLKGGAGA